MTKVEGTYQEIMKALKDTEIKMNEEDLKLGLELLYKLSLETPMDLRTAEYRIDKDYCGIYLETYCVRKEYEKGFTRLGFYRITFGIDNTSYYVVKKVRFIEKI